VKILTVKTVGILVIGVCLATITAAQQSSTAPHDNSLVTNGDIILMTRSKFDDATIIKTLQAFKTDLDVSVAALMKLKEAGVTQPVIQVMLAKATAGDKSPSVDDPNRQQVPASPRPRRAEEPTDNSETTSTNPYPEITRREKSEGGPKPSQPRVYLESVSAGSNRNAARDQSMEMAKDFLKVCPNVKITINQSAADYTIRLNHIEHGLLYRDNQVEVFDKNGDLMRNKEGGSIKKNVQQACNLIQADTHQSAN
jgi:hypothetical protein